MLQIDCIHDYENFSNRYASQCHVVQSIRADIIIASEYSIKKAIPTDQTSLVLLPAKLSSLAPRSANLLVKN